MTARDRSVTLRFLAMGVMAAGVAAAVSSFAVLHRGVAEVPAWMLPLFTLLVTIASAAVVRVRLRSAVAGTGWTEAAILVCIVCLPPAWVPLCVGSGVVVAKLTSRVSPFKSFYNASRDGLAATAGVLAAWPLGIAHAAEPLSRLWALGPVAVVVTVAEYAIGLPVLALASATPWRRVLRTNVDIKVAAFASQVAVAVLAIWLWQLDFRLLVVVPPVALCLHLIHLGRVSARAERMAWQRLAATTEELNHTDLSAVLTSAVVNAATLFSADEAEVFLRDGPTGPVLVRGDPDGRVWSGDPGQAPPRRCDGESVTARLAGPNPDAAPGRVDPGITTPALVDAGPVDLGEVRLHYAGRVSLTERERLALRTFVSALRTAVRNAAAFAEARQLAERNAHAAAHDPLTGLANRSRLHEYGAAVLAQPGVTALVVADLDLFREVNETLGHQAGDRLLVEVARRLTRVVSPDDLVARLGGDEFAVLLRGLPSPALAEQRARELLSALDAPIDMGSIRVRVEASAGVSVCEPEAPASAPAPASPPGRTAVPALSAAFSAAATLAPPRTGGGGPAEQPPGRGGGMVELLRRADVAMYQAKRGGPRIVYYDEQRDTADIAQLMLGGDLPRAIAEGEFVVSFQPIVDLPTGDMISAEALARWQHPVHGDLDPRRFLAAIERSELLPAFAEAVLDQALSAMSQWRAYGVDASVAVNASPRSLLDPTFPRMVRDRLAAHRTRGGDLVIELTETLTLSQVDMVGGVLRELRECGVRLALDDFGTGYSSLAMLAKVPVSELKIDRSFVWAMGSSPEAMAVVRSTVELGRSLGLLVVAEGVESPAQRRTLWELGCPTGQGHLFGRPMPVRALLRTLGEGCGGVVGRLCDPIHALARNVIELPRTRRSEPDAGEARRGDARGGDTAGS